MHGGLCSTQTFFCYEAYADAIKDASLRATFLGRKYTNCWTLSYLPLGNLSVQWGDKGGPGVVEGTMKPSGTLIFMPTENAKAISGNGCRFDDLSLMVLKPGDEFCFSATNYNRWFSVVVPNKLFVDSNGTARSNIGPSHSLIQVPRQAAEKFRSAVEQLGLIVRHQPDVFRSAEAIAATTRKLSETVREALKCRLDDISSPGRHEVPRKQIIRNALDFIDQNANEYLIVEDLATAAGVSERTLRTAFHEYYGVGPMRYLKLRTLHQVREALKAADPSITSVTQIATQFGVWEFGRFAHDYRFLFGELPSKTLHSH
jgi:AraC family transcriptional regulator, ethanolamine operon transcriptional activator